MNKQTITHLHQTLLTLTLSLLSISTCALAQGITDPAFGTGGDTSANGAIEAIVAQSDGKILVGGHFTQIGGQNLTNLARLNADGTLDNTFNVSFAQVDTVYAIAVQSDGKILVGGDISQVNGVLTNNLVRLESSGSTDTTFNGGGQGPDLLVRSIAIQSDGKILIGGEFTSYNGFARGGIARLDVSGALDTSFATGMAGVGGGLGGSVVYVIRIQADGNILIGGFFVTVNGVARNGIARLTATGTLDTTFLNGLAGPNTPTLDMALQPDGKIIMVGDFTTVNGTPLGHVARLNTDGSVDATFGNGLAGADSNVLGVGLAADGKIYIGGWFSTFNGVAMTPIGFARLNSDGTLDTSLPTGLLGNAATLGTGNGVNNLTILSNGQIIIDSEWQLSNQPNMAMFGVARFSPAAIGTVSLNGSVRSAPPPGAGIVIPEAVSTSGQRAGSVLIFNLYTSTVTTGQQDTRIVLTNINPIHKTYVHLFFIDGTNCSVADMFVTLTQNQTLSMLASDIDPGATGYIVAVATNETGCPIVANDLLGGVYVKFESGHRANLSAYGVAALPSNLAVWGCDSSTIFATLRFDGVMYDQLPRTLAIDSLPSRAGGDSTMLIVNRLGGDLAVGAGRLGALFGLLYDDAEMSASFSLTGGTCQLRGILGNNFPRTAPRYDAVIPAGRTGWMKFSAGETQGLGGAMINFSPGGFNQGHNLHVLTTTDAVTYTVPVFPAI
jgi:uncharacterized delta-60 repeat protein